MFMIYLISKNILLSNLEEIVPLTVLTMFNFYICNTCFPIALNPTILRTSYLQGRIGQKNSIKSP